MRLVLGALLVTSFCFSSLGFATKIINCPERYLNGNRLLEGEILRYPNSKLLREKHEWRYPSGTRIIDEDFWLYPNGSLLVAGDLRYENGARFSDGRVLRYKSGARLRDADGTFRAEDGTILNVTQFSVNEMMSQFGVVKFAAAQTTHGLTLSVVYDQTASFDIVYVPGETQPRSITCNVDTTTPSNTFRIVHPKAVLDVSVTNGVDPKAVKEKLQEALNLLP